MKVFFRVGLQNQLHHKTFFFLPVIVNEIFDPGFYFQGISTGPMIQFWMRDNASTFQLRKTSPISS